MQCEKQCSVLFFKSESTWRKVSTSVSALDFVCRFQKKGRRCSIFILMGYRDTHARFESFEAWIDDEDKMSSLKTTIAFTNLHRDFPYWDTNRQGVWAQTHATDKRMLWVLKLELTTKTKWVRWRWRLLSLTCIKISHIDSGKFQLVLINN